MNARLAVWAWQAVAIGIAVALGEAWLHSMGWGRDGTAFSYGLNAGWWWLVGMWWANRGRS